MRMALPGDRCSNRIPGDHKRSADVPATRTLGECCRLITTFLCNHIDTKRETSVCRLMLERIPKRGAVVSSVKVGLDDRRRWYQRLELVG